MSGTKDLPVPSPRDCHRASLWVKGPSTSTGSTSWDRLELQLRNLNQPQLLLSLIWAGVAGFLLKSQQKYLGVKGNH